MRPNFTARSSPSYLIQTPYSYYFRLRIPDDLRLYFNGKTEIKRSLPTGYLSDAKYKARVIAGQIQRLFRYLRDTGKDNIMVTKLTDDLLNDIITNFVQSALEGFENTMLEIENDHWQKRTLRTYNGVTGILKLNRRKH